MTFSIGEAGADDAEQLAAVAAVTFPLACPSDSRQADIGHFIASELSAKRFAEYVADPDRTVLCVRENNELSAYCMLIRNLPTDSQVRAALTLYPTVELSKFYVHPVHHGRGIAGALMDAALETAMGACVPGIWLGVNQENVRALRFYGRHGFNRVGAKTFQLGQRIEDDYILEQALTTD